MHKKEKSIPWNSMKKIERKGKSGNTDAGKVCFGTLSFAGKNVPKGEKDSFFLGWDNSMTKKDCVVFWAYAIIKIFLNEIKLVSLKSKLHRKKKEHLFV